jgi:uncharacterized membrane protein
MNRRNNKKGGAPRTVLLLEGLVLWNTLFLKSGKKRIQARCENVVKVIKKVY